LLIKNQLHKEDLYMKKIITFLLLVAMMATMLVSCTGTTPDEAATADVITDLSDVNWTVEVAGASTDKYTLEQASAHEITKFHARTTVSGQGDVKYMKVSVIVEGILFKEFLADIGAESAAGAKIYGRNISGEEIVFELTAEEMQSEEVMLGWILNKTEPLSDSESYVGIFFDSSYAGSTECCNDIYKIELQ